MDNKLNGRADSIFKGLMIGGLWSAGWTILNVMILSFLISKEIIRFEMIGYCIIFILMSSAYIYAKIAYERIKQKRVIVQACAAAIYFMVLLGLNFLCFGGQYQAVGVTFMCVCGGASLSLLDKGTGKRKSGKYTHKMKRR